MSIEDLRAKALAYSPELPYPIILDREIKQRLADEQAFLAKLREERIKILDLPEEDQPQVPGSTLADLPMLAIDRQIADAEQTLSEAEAEARPESLVLIFRRLSASGPESYQQMLEDHSDDKGTIHILELGDALLAACYTHTEASDGTNVGLTWAEAQSPLDHSDIETLRSLIIRHHRVGAAVSFDPRSSGAHATS